MSSLQPGPGPSTAQPTSTLTGTAAETSKPQTTSTASLPPLTTPWTNPLSCTWTYVVNHPNETAAPNAVAFLDLEPVPGDKTLSCYPDGMFSHGRVGVFSPGTCPGGWTTATVSTGAVASQGTTTTTAICCSYGYTLSGSDCRRSVATALAVPITYNDTARTHSVLTQSTTTLYSALLAVSTIQVLFGDEDKRQLGINNGKSEPGHPMPLATRIGIAVGIGAFVLLCLGLAYFAIARRRRSREGLTKERLMRDLKYMHRHGPSASTSRNCSVQSMSTVASFRGELPPPAYYPGRTRSSLTRGDAECGLLRDGEIRALHEQKAVIQQRLDELESLPASRDRPNFGS